MKLRLVHLTKEFTTLRGKTVAVNDANIEINDREFFVLLGPSGCGKSTLLNLIAGLEKPSGGEIWLNDKLAASAEKKLFIPPKERNAAMVFQNYALYPHLNVFENIAFPLRIARERKDSIKDAVKKAATTLRIRDLLAAKPGELSGGQRQRVAIARAIVRQPDIFLLDEPLSNLDAQLRLSTRTELKNLQRRLNVTTVYVTHDQVEAITLADRIAVLKDGRLEQVGTPDELYSKPINPFVATFIGSPPMNLLEASLTQEDNVDYINIGDVRIRVPDDKVSEIQRLGRQSIVLGIRPENIFITTDDTAQSFKGTIESMEPLGRELLLHISTEYLHFAALTSDAHCKPGDRVWIAFDLTKAHIFEQ